MSLSQLIANSGYAPIRLLRPLSQAASTSRWARKNDALSSGSAVLMNMPLASSNPAAWLTRGTTVKYQCR